jgi:hypothetical protein
MNSYFIHGVDCKAMAMLPYKKKLGFSIWLEMHYRRGIEN